MRIKLLVAAGGILTGLVIAECDRDRLRAPVVRSDAAMEVFPVFDERPGFARAQVAGIVISFIRWSTHDATASCATLPAFAAPGDDPWGTPPKLECTQLDQLRLEVISAGPDRVFGTADDVAASSP